MTSPLKVLTGWLGVHEKEIGLFLWTVALLFVVRASGMLLNNYAETAFLKRFGVEFMPVVTMLNAIATLVIMALAAGLLQKVAVTRLLAFQFLFCGLTIIGARMVVPLGIDLIYPALFMLKSQYEVLLALLFWNLANDLFNTRQSKRLFPLITAGGVIGQILGSFGTPVLVRWLQFDNLLVVYTAVTFCGGALAWAMLRRYPTLLTSSDRKKKSSADLSTGRRLKTIAKMLKSSTLLKIMVVLTFMPNVVIPILNYQFNYAVDSFYASESGLVLFFSYFRGALNIVNLVILLFVGKIYGRWGLPVALMFHPFNYILAFMAFLLRFDIAAAIYARMSTNIIRITINTPANAVLTGLFPESYRSLVRPFLRGTVVRLALLLGSGLILVSDMLFHPRYLSLVALPFVLAWLGAPFVLKKRYASILLDLVSRNQLDFKSMQDEEIGQLFKDKKIQQSLAKAFESASGDNLIWYGRLLARLNVPGWPELLLKRIESLALGFQIELLELLPAGTGPMAIETLERLAGRKQPELTLAVLKALNRLDPQAAALFDRRPYLECGDPRIRAHALAGIFSQAPETTRRTIEKWIKDPDLQTRMAGIIAAGLTGDTVFAPVVIGQLATTDNSTILPEIITAACNLGIDSLGPTLAKFLKHPDSRVRLAALEGFPIRDKAGLKLVLGMLADPDARIRDKALERIANAEFVDGKTLVKALVNSKKAVREKIFELLARLQIKDLDVFRFARNQLRGAYMYWNESLGVRSWPATAASKLLQEHLNQQRWAIVENVLRVLAIQDTSGQMEIIVRGIKSKDPRQKANSIEALEGSLERALGRILIPLLTSEPADKPPPSVCRTLKVPEYGNDLAGLCRHLLQRDDQLSVMLTLYAMTKMDPPPLDARVITPLTNNDDLHIRRLARMVMAKGSGLPQKEDHDMLGALTLPDIILRLKTIEIFRQLSINELAAIASVTRQTSFPKDSVIIREGEPGDTLYLIIEGSVTVNKRQADGKDLELDQINAGDYFGEMALFEDIPRTATIRTISECHVLSLNKHEFEEIVHEYPQIPLAICRVLSGRIRKLHRKITSASDQAG